MYFPRDQHKSIPHRPEMSPMNPENLLSTRTTQPSEKLDICGLPHSSIDCQLPGADQQLFLFDYWRILVKGRWVILFALVLSLSAAILVSLRMTRLYRATGEITIEKENVSPLSLKENGTTSESDPDDVSIDLATQVRILKSNSLALAAIEKLYPAGKEAGMASVADVSSSTPLTGPVPLSSTRREELARSFRAGLEVAAIPDTREVQIAFVSADPHGAANAVNAVIKAYIEQNLRTHFEMTTQAADWLSKQLSDLQIKTEISDEKLAAYQKAQGIVGTDDKQNIITSKLDDLNKELTAAQADRIQKQALYELTLSGGPESVTAIGQDVFLQSLHAQKAELENELAQASVQMGPAYPKVVELKNRIQQVDDTIDAQISKTLGRIHNDYLGALGREKILQSAFDEQKERASQLNQNAIEYNLLKRDSDSNRQLYDDLMQKLKEAGLSAGLSSSNVHIVDSATVPPAPFTPNIPRNIAFGLLAGLAGGVGLAFVLECLDTTVHTPEQAEAETFLPSLAVIPLIKEKRFAAGGGYQRENRIAYGRGPFQPGAGLALLPYTRPNSQVAEAYRALRTSILLSLPEAPPKVVLVTSPLPQDGKSTTSISVAIVLAQEGRRVLLVDGDLRHPSVCNCLGINASEGLSTVLAGYRTPESVILPSPRLPNLFVLPAGPASPCPSELINSEQMKRFLAQWRGMFDHIVIDSPPILAVTDAVRLSIEADAVLLVVRSSQTTKAALRRASNVLAQVKARVLETVVNGLDLKSPERHYYYYSNATHTELSGGGDVRETVLS